jgi:hypothetical protein
MNEINEQTQNAYSKVLQTQLTHVCDHCHLPIDDHTGYFTLIPADPKTLPALPRTNSFRRVVKAERQWKAYHRECDPNPFSADWWNPIEKYRTFGQLLQRDAHMSNKRMCCSTNWNQAVMAKAFAQLKVAK